MKLLSTLSLPSQVADLFAREFAVTDGTLADVATTDADVLLCSISSGGPVDRALIDAFPANLRAIAAYSVGTDYIDLEAARERGIAVFTTPGVLGDAVAETAILLMLGAARRVTEADRLLRSGAWAGWQPVQLVGEELGGKTLGILGMGDIGRRTARRARAFGMRIAYHNRREVPGEEATYYADPRQLVAASDVILLAWPSTPATRRFLDHEVLALAKPRAIVVNIGRGDLVVDEALIAALRERRIFAAGLDVFDQEPAINPAYLDLPNAFLTPHIGSATWQARLAMGQILVDAIKLWRAGGKPANRIV